MYKAHLSKIKLLAFDVFDRTTIAIDGRELSCDNTHGGASGRFVNGNHIRWHSAIPTATYISKHESMCERLYVDTSKFKLKLKGAQFIACVARIIRSAHTSTVFTLNQDPGTVFVHGSQTQILSQKGTKPRTHQIMINMSLYSDSHHYQPTKYYVYRKLRCHVRRNRHLLTAGHVDPDLEPVSNDALWGATSFGVLDTRPSLRRHMA